MVDFHFYFWLVLELVWKHHKCMWWQPYYIVYFFRIRRFVIWTCFSRNFAVRKKMANGQMAHFRSSSLKSEWWWGPEPPKNKTWFFLGGWYGGGTLWFHNLGFIYLNWCFHVYTVFLMCIRQFHHLLLNWYFFFIMKSISNNRTGGWEYATPLKVKMEPENE